MPQSMFNRNKSGQGFPLGTLKPTVWTGADMAINFPTRCITAIDGTKITVDLKCIDGTANQVVIPAGIVIPIINLSKIYASGTDVTASGCYIWPAEEPN